MKELVYSRLLLPAVAANADSIATIDGTTQRTYAEHGERVLRLANALKSELGIERSDRFAVMATNSAQYIELYHAAFLGAGVVNPLNLRLAGKELDYIIRDSGTEVAFVDAMFAQHLASAFGGEVEADRALVAVDADEIGRVLFVEGRAPVAHLVACGRLDLDHVGAVVGEDLRAIGAAEHAREIDHAQARHRAGGLGIHESNLGSDETNAARSRARANGLRARQQCLPAHRRMLMEWI